MSEQLQTSVDISIMVLLTATASTFFYPPPYVPAYILRYPLCRHKNRHQKGNRGNRTSINNAKAKQKHQRGPGRGDHGYRNTCINRPETPRKRPKAPTKQGVDVFGLGAQAEALRWRHILQWNQLGVCLLQ